MATFEIDTLASIRNLVALEQTTYKVASQIDQLELKASKIAKGVAAAVRQSNDHLESFEKALESAGIRGDALTRKMATLGQVVSSNLLKIATDNLRVSQSFDALSDKASGLNQVLRDTKAKQSWIQTELRIGNLAQENANNIQLLSAQIKNLQTTNGQMVAALQARLSAETRLAAADEKTLQNARLLQSAEQQLTSAQGQQNAVKEAQIRLIRQAIQEGTVLKGSLDGLSRAYQGEQGALKSLVDQQAQRNSNTRQSITFALRQAGVEEELARQMAYAATEGGKNAAVTRERIKGILAAATAEEREKNALAELNRALEGLSSGGMAKTIAARRQMVRNQEQAANAAEREKGQYAELIRQLSSMTSGLGTFNAQMAAHLAVMRSAAAEQINYDAKVEQTQRNIQGLTDGTRQALPVLKAQEQGLVQAATAAQREANQLAELERRNKSLTDGTARQIIVQREKNAQLEASIRQEVKGTQTTEQLTQATANQRAADERSAAALKAKEAVLMETARGLHQMTQAEAQAQAKAEAASAANKRHAAALLDAARAAHGMSKAQVELANAREQEVQKLARLQQQVQMLRTGYGQQLAQIQAQIVQQERYNRLLSMSTAELLGFSNAQARANAQLNIGSQSAAMLRAGLAGLQSSIGMYTSSTILAAAATYGLTRALKESVTLGAEFTATMARADAIMSKGGSEWMTSNLGAMESQVRALGQTTVYTASEVAAGLVELGQAGVSSADAITALKPALTLAQVGNISMAESADIATNVMMTFGYEAKDLAMIVDEMSFAVANSNTTISQLANALSYAGPAAEAAGISMRETIVAVEALSNNGIKASRAGTALRRLFVSLLNPTKKGQEVLDQYGISVKDLEGNTRSLSDVLGQLQGALQGVSDGERLTAVQNLVGVYATSSVAALINSTDQFKKALRDHELLVEGAAERMRGKMEQGLKFDWKQTLSAFEEVQLQFFDKFEMQLRNTSALMTKYLVDLTLPKMAWSESGDSIALPNIKAQVELDSLIDAEAVARASGNMGDLAVATYRVEEAVKALGVSFDAAMKVGQDGNNTVVTGLDELIGKFIYYGEIVGKVAAGFLAFKLVSGAGGVFGALSSDLSKLQDRTQALSEKMKASAAAQLEAAASSRTLTSQVAASRTAAVVASTGYQQAAVGAASLARATSAAAAGVSVLSKALGVAAAAGRGLLAFSSWGLLVWGVYEAVSAVFSSSSEERAREHASAVQEAKNSYDRLKASVEAYGEARERAALREEQKSVESQIQDITAREQQLIESIATVSKESAEALHSELGLLAERKQALEATSQSITDKLQDQKKVLTDVSDVNNAILKKEAQKAALLDRQARISEQIEKLDPFGAAGNLPAAFERLGNEINQVELDLASLRAEATNTASAISSITSAIDNMNRQVSDAVAEKRRELYETPGQLIDRLASDANEVAKEFESVQARLQMAPEAAQAAASATRLQMAELAKQGGATAEQMAELNKQLKYFETVPGTDTQESVTKRRIAAENALMEARKAGSDVYQKGIEAQQRAADLNKTEAERLASVRQELGLLNQAIKQVEAEDSSASNLEAWSKMQERKATLMQEEKSLRESMAKEGAKTSKQKLTDDEKALKKLQELIDKSQLAEAGSRSLAAAYLDQGARLHELTVSQKVEEELLKLTHDGLKNEESARQRLTKAIEAEKNAADELAIAKKVFDIRSETKDLYDNAQAVFAGEEALREYNIQKEIAAELADKNAGAISAETSAQLEKTVRDRDAAALLKEQAERYGSLVDEMDPARVAQREYKKNVEAVNAAVLQGNVSLEEAARVLGHVEAKYKSSYGMGKVWAEFTEGATERVDEAFANMWLNIDQGFESFADGLKQGFKQLLAELAHAAITRPITISFMNSLLGTNKAGGISEVWGGGGGGSGGFGLSDAFGLVKNGFSIANSGFGQAIGAGWSGGQGFFGGLQGAFNSGSSYLGSLLSGGSTATTTLANGTVQFLPGGSAATVDLIGNTVSQGGNVVGTASGMTTGATTWGSAASGLGAILGGVGGAFQGYQKAGLKGAVAGGLGGWGGATLGTMAGAAVAAAVSGTAMGAALGSVIPGIGTAIGAALGAAFGSSLFGGDWVTKHSGVAVGAKEGQFQGFNYEYMEKKGGLFGSDKSKYKYSDMDATLEKQLSKQFDSVVETVPRLFEKLGFDIAEDALDGLSVGMRHIALSGSPEKQQEQLEKGLAKWFSKVGNVATADIGQALVSGFAADITETTAKALGEALQQAGLNLSEKQLKQLDGLSGDKLVKKLSAMKVDGAKVGEAAAQAVGKTVDDARAAALETLTTLDAELAESLKGLKGKKLEKELEKLTGFGDKAYEQLTELVTKLETVNLTFETLNLTLYDGSLAGAKMAEDLVAVAGGLEEFTKKTASYYDKFFSETEKAEDSLEAVIRQFADANLVLPANHRQFRAVVESIDASTAAGRELFNTMMNLAEGADAAYGAFATLRQGLLDAVLAEQARVEGLISAAQQAVMEAYGRQSSELSAVISKWDRFSDSLKKFRADLDATILATASPQKQLEVLRKEFGVLLAKAKLGDEQALEALPGTGAALAAEALAGSSSREDYVRELARLRAGAAEAEAAVGRQKSVAEQQLAALNAQMEELKLITSALPTFEEAVKTLLKARIDGAEAISEAEKAALTAEIDWLSRQIGKGLADQNMSAVASILSLGFGALDSSVDGLLDAAELTKALEGVAGPDEVAAIISAMDANTDGMISAAEAGNLQLGNILEDLLGGIASQDSSAVVSALRAGFASLDTNVDGLLTAAELTTALGPLAKGVDIAMVVAGIDSNGDGFISAIELGSSREVMAINAVEAAIRAQAAQVGGGITENLGDAGKDVTLAEFKKAVQTAAAAKGISASVANDSFVSSLFNQMDTNRNGKIRQGGAKNEYSQVAVENAIADLLKAQQTPTTPGSTTPPAKYTYDKAKVADSLEAAIDAALGVSGFSPQSYLKKNSDVAGFWPGLASRTKGSYNNDPNLYGAWHYWNFGRKENRQFFTGGYTGPGGMFEEAGTVHKGEVVWNQFDVARFGGWRAVEALRKGGISTKGPARGRSESTGVVGLQRAISDLNEGLRAIAKHTEKTARRVEYLERWDYDGMPGERA